jgi:proteasome component ECM29
LALSDLLRSRTFTELGDDLEELWKIIFRVVDDVKETVREAALQACKRLQRCSTQMCKEGGERGQAAVAIILPIMLEVGLVSTVKTVKAISLQVLVEVSKEAGEALKPHAASLVLTLLEALSGTESGQLDYLANLMNDDHLANVVDDVRTNMARGSPLQACLDDCIRHIDADSLPQLVPGLVDIIKGGLGVSTRAGAARLVGDLVRQCREALQPFGKKLLKALVAGAACKSAPLQREFARAFAMLARVAVAVGSVA